MLRGLLSKSGVGEGDWLMFDRDINETNTIHENGFVQVEIPRTRSALHLLKVLIRTRLGLIPLIRERYYDALIAHSLNSSFIAVAIRSRLKLPVVLDVHGVWVDEVATGTRKLLIPVFHWVERYVMRRADGFIFASENLRETLLSKYPFLNHRPSAVVPCLSDPAHFYFSEDDRRDVRKSWGWESSTICVHVGVLYSWVDVCGLIEFMRTCQDHIPATRFLFLTHDTDEIRQLLDQHGLSRVSRCMSVPHADVYKYLSAADIGLIARKYSVVNRVASPTKVAEYLLTGLPVLASKGIGDNDKMITELKAGLVVPSFSEIGAEAVAELQRFSTLDRARIRAEVLHRCYDTDYKSKIATLLEAVVARSSRPQNRGIRK